MITKWDSAFGKNDLRGIYGQDITEELYFFVGKAYVKYITALSGKTASNLWLTVCRDARNHSPKLSASLISGLTSAGANVIDLGLAPTPIGYYSNAAEINDDVTDGNKIDGALIVTASHNPSQYNGLKMTYNGQILGETAIQELLKYVSEVSKESLLSHTFGKSLQYDLIPDYINELKLDFKRIGEGLKIVVDSANGTGGIVAPALYRSLGCQVIELYSNPDGNFPNHHPNPSDEKTLEQIKRTVVEEKADFGIAFDGDSDRIGVIDSKGNSMTGDKLLLIFAENLIEKYKNTDVKPIVVSEVKCSQVLFDTINKIGGEAVMCKTGHGFIKAKMKETNAMLAGEMSGHTFFKDRFYGFDDAIYAGVRIIEILSKHKRENKEFVIENLLTPFDEVFTSPELRLPCPNELKKPVLEGYMDYVKENPRCFGNPIKDVITMDGMRIVFDGGFALIRQSNTEPVFTCRFEGKNEKEVEIYRNSMVETLNELISELDKKLGVKN